MSSTATALAPRPLRAALGLTGIAVGATLLGALAVELVAPESDPLLRRLRVVLILLVMSLVVARRIGWRQVAAGGPRTWHDLRLLAVPLGIALVPLAWGWAPEAGTLLALVVGYAATGAFEELWYRGVVLRAALPLGPIRAAAASAILFGSAHLANIAFGASPAITAAQAVGSAAGGFGYAVLRLRTNAVWALAFIHGLGDLLLHTTGLRGGALWAVLVGHDVALFVWGLVVARALRSGLTASRGSAGRGLAPWGAAAAGVYVGAWLVGLAAPSARVDRAVSDAAVQAEVLAHGGAIAMQAALVHAVAGAALLLMVLAAARFVPARLPRRVLIAAGAAASALSLLQALLALVMTGGAAAHDAAWTRSLLDAIDALDVAKLLMIAAAVAVLGRSGQGLARWLRTVSAVLPARLVVGAVGLIVPSALLDAVLAGSLVVLLVWAGGVGVLLLRGPRPVLGGPALSDPSAVRTMAPCPVGQRSTRPVLPRDDAAAGPGRHGRGPLRPSSGGRGRQAFS